MSKYNVLVTGIGGNVGQGILRNLQSTGFNLRLIGCNISRLSAGNHFCDAVYEVPFAYDADYISRMSEICQKEQIHMIIPSTDYEVYYLSLAKKQFNALIPVSEPETNIYFLDKYKTWQLFCTHNIPFAESFLPSEYDNRFADFILKPREGRGSRGIHVNPKEWKNFSDEYMIQKLHKGKEITTAFYVNRFGKLHGLITFERELQSGATAFCEVCSLYDDKLLEIIEKIMNILPVKGSCNIQAIVDEKTGNIVPFEINGRISGTNSIRSQFGFKDVQYYAEEYLFDKMPEPVQVQKGCAVRILTDVIFPDISLNELKNKHNEHYLF
jgi:carbamoyl-phosphate synthase large subunit